MDIKTIKLVVPELIKLGQVPIFVGHRGMGKTEVMGQIAKAMGGDLHTWRLGQMSDPGDIIGLAQPTGQGTVKFMPPDHLPKNGRGIIFLDELNRAPKDLLQAMFEFVERGSFVSYKKPEGFGIVAACNPDQAGYTLETALEFDDAFADRMIFIKFEPSTDDWIAYGRQQEFDPSVLAYIAEHPQDLDGEIEPISLDFIKPSRRSWTRLSIIKKALGMSFPEHVLLEIMSGICGIPLSIKFMKYAKDFEKNIKPEQILNNYPSFKESVIASAESRHDLINASNGELLDFLRNAESISEQQVNNLLSYLIDIPKDMAWDLFAKINPSQFKCFSKDANKKAYATLFDNSTLVEKLSKEFFAENKSIAIK